MSREIFMSRFAFLGAAHRAAALSLAAMLAACSAGGPATTVNQPTSNASSTANSYTGPAAGNADIQAFKVNLWENIRQPNRCGGCHHEGGQSPQFARSDDVNLAYQAAAPLVNFSQPNQSELVLKVGSGHNCWVADPQSCADTMLTWIKAWVGAGSASATGITLTAPVSQTVGSGKQFPADSTQFQTLIWTPILRNFCVNCHRPDAATPQQPYFASSNPDDAYVAAQPKINLNTPNLSRFYVRLHDEFHNCWATTPGGAPDCPGSAAAMLSAITAYANTITATPVDPSLVLSKALGLKQGTIASGGNRVENALVAKYEFKTPTGVSTANMCDPNYTTTYDTSGVSPEADLTFTGNVCWAGGWGVTFGAGGKAQASTAASSKIADMIKSTGEFTVEAWASPANVAQTNAYIVSYSGSATTRNVTLGQHAMQYEAYTRSDQTSTNGMPPLQTAVANMNAQAALQHIVLTYDPVNGQKLYVNGQYTGDVDPKKGGSLASWDDTFALVLGNEVTGTRQWLGTIKFVEIQNRALTAAEIAQNFAAGVGERYYVLFDVSAMSGVPQSYIMMLGSVYDSYSYLLTSPTFISLDPNAAPSSIAVKGMRIGVNGVIGLPGQSYSTMNVTLGGASYTPASGQLLSSVGAVIASDKGPDSDLLFLSFDQFGSSTHVFTEPIPAMPTPTDNPPSPDLGVRNFAEINATMSTITGVPSTNTTINTLYGTLQQSLPPAPQIEAFLASQQTAISQMASAYCQALVGTPSSRDAFFGTGLDASLGSTSASFFGTAGDNAAREIVISALISHAVGSANPNYGTAVKAELNALFDKIPTLGASPAPTVQTATTAACSAVLGSAVVSLK
jgi:hypothetical protein